MKSNKIILGTVQFGLEYGINNVHGKPDQNQVDTILLKAQNAAIQTLDTAEAYGNAHEVIGAFHKRYPSTKFQINTKLTEPNLDTIDIKVEFFLEQLKVEQLQAISFHSFDSYSKNLNVLKRLKYYKDSGLIQNIGVSVYTNEQLSVVLNDPLLDIIQLPYNVFDNINVRGEFLRKAKLLGKTIHTRSAFLQGLFFTESNDERNVAIALRNELNLLRDISKESRYSVGEIALNYCLQEELIDNIILGVETLEQLESNLAYANVDLSEEIIARLNKINIENPNLLNPSLWN